MAAMTVQGGHMILCLTPRAESAAATMRRSSDRTATRRALPHLLSLVGAELHISWLNADTARDARSFVTPGFRPPHGIADPADLRAVTSLHLVFAIMDVRARSAKQYPPAKGPWIGRERQA